MKSISSALINFLGRDEQTLYLMKTGFTIMVLRVLGLLLGFSFAIVVSRNIGAGSYGEYSLLLAWIIPLSAFAGLGSDKYILKYVSRLNKITDVNQILSIRRLSQKITISVSILIAAVLLCFKVFISTDFIPIQTLVITLLCFPVLAQLILNCFVLKAMDSQVIAVFLEMVMPIGVTLLLMAIMIIASIELSNVLTIYLGGLGSTFVVSELLIRKSLGEAKSSKKVSFSDFTEKSKQVIKSSFPMYTTSVITSLIVSADVLMLSWYQTTQQLAIYSVCMSISRLLPFPMGALIQLVAPKYSIFYKDNDIQSLKQIHYQSIRLILLVSLPIIIILLAFPEKLLMLFGTEFLPGVGLIYVLLVGQIANIIVGPVGYLMWMTDLAGELQKIMICVLIINIFMNALLIPEMGLTGAAIATSTALFIKNIWSIYVVKKRLGFLSLPPLKELVRWN